MPDRQLPERDPDLLQIETPVIDIQDLEHKPTAETRVNNSGVRVQPRAEPQLTVDENMFAREDQQAREAIAKFEEWLKKQPTG